MSNEIQLPTEDIITDLPAPKKSAWASQNAFVTILSIILFLLESNGITIGLTPEGIIGVVTGVKGVNLLYAVVLNFGNVFVKIAAAVAKGKFSFKGLYNSLNARTQIATILSGLLAPLIGVDVSAFTNLLMAIVNFLSHLFESKTSPSEA